MSDVILAAYVIENEGAVYPGGFEKFAHLGAFFPAGGLGLEGEPNDEGG
jgi:hypothetical protein